MKAKEAAPGPFDAHSAEAGGCRVRIAGSEVRKRAAFALRSSSTSDAVRRLWEKDSELWGADAAAEAAIRLDWLDLPRTSRELLPEIERVRESLIADGLDHIVLVGMGGLSLAPEVICAGTRVELTVLDTTDPMQLRRALADRIERTVVVVASQRSSSIETDSHRRVYVQAFRDAGLDDAEIAARFIVIADPESAVEEAGREGGYRAVFLAERMVGGRYSALSAFGLVPSGLAGADVAAVLDDAAALRPALGKPTNNPGLLLGAALGGAALHKRDKLALVTTDPALRGFGHWIEQLVAQSTCKQGRGLLPVLIERADSPGFVRTARDVVRASIGSSDSADIEVAAGPLGAQFLLWEWVAAFVCWALGVNPFDQSDVTDPKDDSARFLSTAEPGGFEISPPLFTDGPIEVHGDPALFGDAETLLQAMELSLRQVSSKGYLALLAYLDRIGDADVARLRPALAKLLSGRPVTFGWGPRFVPATGPSHQGGPQDGVFLQITGTPREDLPVPGKPYTFGTLQMAQALRDLGALTRNDRPVLRLHLTDRKAGTEALLTALSA